MWWCWFGILGGIFFDVIIVWFLFEFVCVWFLCFFVVEFFLVMFFFSDILLEDCDCVLFWVVDEDMIGGSGGVCKLLFWDGEMSWLYCRSWLWKLFEVCGR